MPTFLVRWPNDEVVLAKAPSKRVLMATLDTVNDPSCCEIKEFDGSFAVSFRPAARWSNLPERAPCAAAQRQRRAAAKPVVQQRNRVEPEPRLGAGLLSDDMSARWRAGKLDCTADLRLRSEDGAEFLTHRSILACRSDFMQTVFSNQAAFAELPRSDAEDHLPVLALEVASHTLEALLEMIYTDHVPAALLPSQSRRDHGFCPPKTDEKALSSLERSDRLLRLLLLTDQLMASSLKRALESVVSSSLSSVATEYLSHWHVSNEACLAAVDLLVGAAESCVAIGVDGLFSRAIALLAAHRVAIPPGKLEGLDERVSAALRENVDSNPPAPCGLVSLPYSVQVARSTAMGWVNVLEPLVCEDVREATRFASRDAGGDARAAAVAAVGERKALATDTQLRAKEAAAAAGVPEAQAAAAESQKAAGNLAFKTAQYARAVELYSAAIDLNPHRVEYFTNRAIARLRLVPAAAKDALEDAESALRLDPLYWKAYARKSAALRALKREPEALSTLVVGMDVATSDAPLERLLKEAVRAQSMAVAEHEFLASNVVGDNIARFLWDSGPMVPLQLTTVSEFPDAMGEHRGLQNAIDRLFFPKAAKLSQTAIEQSHSTSFDEPAEAAIGEIELKAAVVHDCVAKRAKAIEKDSLRYLSWLRGDKMAGLELSGNSFAAQQAAAGFTPTDPLEMFRYAGLAAAQGLT
jgi:tetratricopeptide (TPR) repeat protein